MSDREPRFRHTAIRASAGAGKTHQLTNRFIALLAAGETPDRVLATTFTRKAAGEILERILQRLAAAALDTKRCGELREQLDDPSLTPARACALVGTLARHLHRLHARTLDSFFAGIARSFAIELDLPPDWEIINESADATLRTAAIQAALRNGTPRELTELVRKLSGGDAARSVADRISRIVKSQHTLFCETDAAAWQRIPRPPHRTATEIEQAVQRLSLMPVPDTQKGEPNKKWLAGRDRNIEAVRAGDWETFVGKGIAAAIIADKPAFERQPIAPEIAAIFEPLIAEARAVLVGRVADRCQASHQLLERFDDCYRRLQRRKRGLRFEDITRALATSATVRRYQEIYFRLDAEVRHVLLDEFQDTSLQQWEVVRPLAEEIHSYSDGSHSLLCVGDAKQAIYGWRGGVTEIFESLRHELPSLDWQPLNKSRRSSPVIIDVVNRVFGGLASNPALAKHADAASRWAAKFEKHETAMQELPGYVCLDVAPRVEEGERKDKRQREQTLVYAADAIQRITTQSPGRSIGVLVRKNDAIARLIHELRERGIHASAEGGNPLTDTPAVTVLLSLLKLTDHPGDTAARFHVATSPLGPLVELTNHADDAAAHRVAARVRRLLVQDGYGPTIHEWVRQLTEAAACDPSELNRLRQLTELAHRYEPDATLRPAAFVRFVEATPVEDPVPALVRVMTIHKAKGLQFHVVVLPDLDSDLIPIRPPVVTGRVSATGRIDRVCPYAKSAIRALLPPEFQQLFDDWESGAVREELCVLYVSLTRAIHAMHLIVAPTKAKSGEKSAKETVFPATFAGILHAAIGATGAREPNTTAYEHGEPDWHERDLRANPRPASPPVTPTTDRIEAADAIERDRALTAASTSPIRLAATSAHAARGLARESPSNLEGGHRVQLRNRLRLGNAPALERGSLFHTWFKLIEWLDDGELRDATLSDVTLLAAAERSGVRCDNLDEQIAEYRAMLGKPEIRAALVRPPCPPGRTVEVWRERPFVIRTGDTLLAGKFDRVVIMRDGPRVVRAEVLDFKTDAILADDPSRADEQTEHYRPQLDAYRKAAARLLNLDASLVGARLLFVTIGAVKEL